MLNHKHISYLKSFIRIIACILAIVLSVFYPVLSIIVFSSLFLIAELFGILEEIFDKRKEK